MDYRFSAERKSGAFLSPIAKSCRQCVKYQRNDTTPQIHIAAENQGEEWLFSVRDNGIGMKQEYCQQIFQAFKRLHAGKEYAGTGMGLAICQKIVKNMGGHIWAESKPNEGSVFYFTLPKNASPLSS